MTEADGVEIRTIPGDFPAAEVLGFDPTRDLARPSVAEAVREALAGYGVLCLRIGEKLDKDAYRAVTSLFGPIKNPVARTRDGSLFQYDQDRQVIDSGFVMTEAFRRQLGDRHHGGLDAERPGLFETFHIDDSYTEEPAAATVLHARALQEHAETRAPRYQHVWRPFDVLAWDNASVQHKAGGDFPVGEPRRFWRHMIAGGQPT